jgi:chromosome segregation ATPase
LKLVLKRLPGIVVVPVPEVSSETLKKMLAVAKMSERISVLKTELEELDKSLSEFPQAEPVPDEKIVEYERKLRQSLSVESQIASYKKDLEVVERTRFSLDIEKEMDSVKLEKTKLEKELIKSKRALVLVGRFEALERDSDECERLKERELKFQRLLAVVQKATVKSLKEIINSANVYLSVAAKRLFTEPMEIRLSTERELKSGAKKQEINLVINYKGGIVHNIDRGLSGGEKARINAILSLALTRYCESGILILDEVNSFLGDIDGRNLIELVRDPCLGVPSKLVLMASQNSNSGLADRVVEYETLLG